MNELQAGCARVDITPELGVPMGGYWERCGTATQIDMPLYARAVVFVRGAQRCALVSLDLVALSATVVDDIRRQIADRTGMDEAAVMVCASHTHSGPLTLDYRGMGAVDPIYIERILRAVVQAVEKAASALESVHLHYARAGVDLGVNRRTEDGPVVPHAHVVWCESARGPLAILLQYACHPVVLGASNLCISGDFVGAAARHIEAATGATALYFNGACGDINPRLTQLDAGAVSLLGKELATATLGVRAGAQQIEVRGLRWLQRRIDLPLRAPSGERRQRLLQYGKWLWRSTIKRADEGARRAARARWEWARDVASDGAPATRSFALHGMAIGSLVFLGFEGEMFARYQLDIEAHNPRVVCCGLANGCIGYVPTADEYARGGYEIEEGYKVYPGTRGVGAESEAMIRAATDEVLAALGVGKAV